MERRAEKSGGGREGEQPEAEEEKKDGRKKRKNGGGGERAQESALWLFFPRGLPLAPPCLSRSRRRRRLLSPSRASRAAPALERGRARGTSVARPAGAEHRSGLSRAASRLPQGQPPGPGEALGPRLSNCQSEARLLAALGVGGCQPSRLAAVGWGVVGVGGRKSGSARETGGWSGEEWRRGERGEEGLGEGKAAGMSLAREPPVGHGLLPSAPG